MDPPLHRPGIAPAGFEKGKCMPPPKKATAAADQVTVCALHPVKHNGTTYGPKLPDGDELKVSALEATALQAAGAVELVEAPAAEAAE